MGMSPPGVAAEAALIIRRRVLSAKTLRADSHLMRLYLVRTPKLLVYGGPIRLLDAVETIDRFGFAFETTQTAQGLGR
jgi:hypothetical protein